MYVMIFVILYELDQALNATFELKEDKRNPVSEKAVYFLTVGMIVRVIVFFLSLLIKPLY